jgi:hypothetical protein
MLNVNTVTEKCAILPFTFPFISFIHYLFIYLFILFNLCLFISFIFSLHLSSILHIFLPQSRALSLRSKFQNKIIWTQHIFVVTFLHKFLSFFRFPRSNYWRKLYVGNITDLYIRHKNIFKYYKPTNW